MLPRVFAISSPFFSHLCQQTRESGNKVTSLKFHSFPLDKLYFSNLIFTVRSSPPTEKTGFKRLDESSVCFKFVHGTLAQNDVRSEFYRKLKSYSCGYASFDYEIIGYRPTELVKVDILLNRKMVDALSVYV